MTLITITQADIDACKGHYDDCNHNPIALAASRAYGQAVSVQGDRLFMKGDGMNWWYLPDEAIQWLGCWDAGNEHCWAFEFRMPDAK